VNAAYEAVVSVSLHGPAGQAREIEAVIDTGYNGFLTLPTATVAELQLPFLGRSRATLANGAVETFNVHDATVLWDGQLRDIEADVMGSTPLVGMLLLDGHDLNIQVRDGGRVVIQAGE
jgi:clan AA aspartic protease